MKNEFFDKAEFEAVVKFLGIWRTATKQEQREIFLDLLLRNNIGVV
jgi:hypothetical protein